MTTQKSGRAHVLSDEAWAKMVADQGGLDDVGRVRDVLAESGVHSGRPPAGKHSITIEGVYFAGVKDIEVPGAVGDQSGSLTVEGASTRRSKRVPGSVLVRTTMRQVWSGF